MTALPLYKVQLEKMKSNVWLLITKLLELDQQTAGHTGLKVLPLKSVLALMDNQSRMITLFG